jgi:hypothetical protein
MIYRNSELRLDSLITYLNEDKINLSPVFQRGHVWPVATRRKLVRNIIQGKPIPAIFIYKEASGSRYSYNILDGKQRVESLILFIGLQPPGKRLSIPNWASYFSDPKDRKGLHFWVELPDGKKRFKDLPDFVIADLGEYSIPTIEITLTEETTLDEIIDLFVDINQEGVPVKRFDVVKAIGIDNPLLKSVFDLIALEEHRARDIRYKAKNNEFTYVLKALAQVAKVPDSNAKIDRIWERLLEVVSYVRTQKHRQPSEILKSFIKTRSEPDLKPEAELTSKEMKTLRKIFRFLKKTYRSGLVDTSLATDQTYFYTMITSLISGDLLDKYTDSVLQNKLIRFASLIATPNKRGPLRKALSEYMELSQKQTTHPGRRDARQGKFMEIIAAL